MKETRFQRNIEDFECEHCKQLVVGNGYTNHCPRCLWSKHVDVHPGDRAANCGGLMEPFAVESKGGSHDIVHRCIKCGYTKRNKVQTDDDFNEVIKIATPKW